MLRVVVVIMVLAVGAAGGWFAHDLYNDRQSNELRSKVEDAAMSKVSGDVESVECERLVKPPNVFSCNVENGIGGLSETVRVTTSGDRIVSAKNLGFGP